MLISFLLSLLMAMDIDLQPIDEPVENYEEAGLGMHDGFLITTGDKLHYWDHQGNFVLTIIIEPDSIRKISAFHFDGKYFLLCGYNHKRHIRQTLVYDREGNFQYIIPDSYLRYFIPLKGELLGGPNVSEETLYESPCFFLINRVEFHPEKQELSSTPAFCKLNPKQKQLAYNHKRVWVTRKEDTFYLMNEVEDRVYIYTPEIIKKEHSDGTKRFTPIPYEKLELPKYRQPPDHPFMIDRPMPKDQANKNRRRWWNSWSRITCFGGLSNGYVVAYEIPDCPSGDRSKCISTHMGIQRLDANFATKGELIETEGIIMGVRKNQLFLFEADKSTDEQPERLLVRTIE